MAQNTTAYLSLKGRGAVFARALPREPPGVGGRACHAQRVIELRPVCRIRRHRRQVQFVAAARFIAMWWNRVWRVVDRWPHAHARAPASGSAASCSAGQPACDDRASVHGRQSCSGPNTPLRPPRSPRVWRHAVLNIASAAYNMQETTSAWAACSCRGPMQECSGRAGIAAGEGSTWSASRLCSACAVKRPARGRAAAPQTLLARHRCIACINGPIGDSIQHTVQGTCHCGANRGAVVVHAHCCAYVSTVAESGLFCRL